MKTAQKVISRGGTRARGARTQPECLPLDSLSKLESRPSRCVGSASPLMRPVVSAAKPSISPPGKLSGTPSGASRQQLVATAEGGE